MTETTAKPTAPPKAPAKPKPAPERAKTENGKFPYRTKMGRRPYEDQKAKLQAELLKVQHWSQETGQKFVLFCAGGLRSALAAKRLQDMGFGPVAHFFAGEGLNSWAGLGCTHADAQPRVI